LKAWQTFLKSGANYALIMEDDVEFCNNFKERFESVITELPKDFHIMYVGGRFEPEFQMSSKNCTQVSEHIIQHTKSYTYQDRLDLDRTLHAYIISNAGARLLLNSFHHYWTIVNDAIDLWMLQTFLACGTPIYSAQPLLCYSPNNGNSDIR
jgi:GR25 family glycosyltransferase involved in LPS biosynthesis